ncbi:WYL domain-containing protein [Klebsiella pneumoniae]|uniref:WYL domain-containing protein n=1 Tax=Klebsiella pneumoniae TaxID=573 RepID=UPI0028BEC79B|nr:WYL domain-containing protein [Klebsiella pneumoniae]
MADWAPSPWRTLDEKTLETMVRTIQQRKAIRVSYQSMTAQDDLIRLLSPHALGYDGFRWHVRAFCHKRQRFSHLVLARILRIDGPKRGGLLPRYTLREPKKILTFCFR